jgi:pyridoxine/pyridoxamine 5'-phosphate oxidase
LETPLLTEPEIRQRIWMELQRATQDRHHEWRTPMLATVGADGLPQARTVVLRQADPRLCKLQIYTDSRSPKVAELAAKPQAMLVFWSKRLSWQLRVQAVASVQHTGPEVDAVWTKVSQSAAAGDYLSARAPGDVLPAADAASAAEPGLQQPHHLAIVTAQVQEMDWLELARSGHRRAVFQAEAWQWRVP